MVLFEVSEEYDMNRAEGVDHSSCIGPAAVIGVAQRFDNRFKDWLVEH